MAYYLGFLKKNVKHAVVFQSVSKPLAREYNYFEKVIGPFKTESEARKGLKTLQEFYGVRENPPAVYHDRKFLRYVKELEKYKVGSRPYIETLARAWEHAESSKDS